MGGTIPETGRQAATGRHAVATAKPPIPKWQARLVVFLTILVVLFASLAYALTRKEIQLTVDGQTRKVVTHRALVRTFLASQSVHLGPADEVAPSLTTRLDRKASVVVYRAVPITIQVDGRSISLQSAKQTVREAVASANIVLGEHDRLEPEGNAAVTAGLNVIVHRVEIKDVTQSLDIPFSVLKRQDANLERGQTKVIKPGVKGLKQRVVRITSEDGQEKSRVLVSEKVVKEPQPQLVAVGTKKVVRTLRTSRGEYRYVERRVMAATAYDPGPKSNGPNCDGYTYLGLKAKYGIVAVDPRVIPLRSRLYIPGYGEALAGDIGGAIKGNRIDLCYNTYDEAMAFGRQKVEVYILE